MARDTRAPEAFVKVFNARLEWVLLSIIRFTGSAAMTRTAALQAHTVPLFLEGPTRRMKVLKTKAEKKALYEQVG